MGPARNALNAARVRRLGHGVEAGIVLVFASAAVHRRAGHLLGDVLTDASSAPEPAAQADVVALAEAQQAARAVARVARVLPWHPACLTQAIALRIMLRRRGIACRAHLGVVSTAPFTAHAWVTVGGNTVLGGGTSAGELASFA